MDPDSDPDSDPDPAIFVIDLQDANKNKFFTVLMFITFLRYMYIIFSKIKSLKEVTEQ
jgi:hypothetical protein